MSKKENGEINGFLNKGVTIKGEIRFQDMLRLDGKVEGKIVSDSHLVVGASAEINGEVIVGRATLSGTVRGTVKASDRIELLKGGKIYADLTTPKLIIEEGAFFEGRCIMDPKSAASKPSMAIVDQQQIAKKA